MKPFVTALLIIFISISHAYAEQPFIWADDEDFAPFMSKTKHHEIKGIFRDIVSEVFARMEVPLEIKVYPWKRTQVMVKEAKADAMVTIPTEKRLAFLNPTDPIVSSEYRVFTRDQHPKKANIMAINEIKQLKDYRRVDYIGDGWAEKNFKGFNVKWAPQYTNAIIMLAQKRADVFVADSIMMKYRIKNLIADGSQYSENLKKVVESPNTLASIPFTLLIRKDSKYASIIPEFNKVLKEVKQDGTYQKILDNYTNIQ